MYRLFALTAILFLVINCKAQVLYPTTTKGDTGTLVNIEIRGLWKSIGGGYLLDATDQEIILYSYTSKYCYKEKNDYLTGLLNSASKFFLSQTKDTLSIYLQDFAEKTKELQDEKKFYKLNQLPDNCLPLTHVQQNDPEFLFELFWVTLKENYAFAEERHLDWDQIYKNYQPKISSQTTQEDLFNLLGEIVILTKDQHTKIISVDGNTKQYSGLPSALLLREVFNQQSSVKNFNDYINQFFKTNYDNISRDLLHNKGKKLANGKIEWGDLTADIGYIHIHSLTGFAADKLSRKLHIDSLNYVMSHIMNAFQNKKAIIVDVSFNFGGYDAAGLTIAGYFTDKPFKAFTKYTFQNGIFHEGSEFTIHPSAQYNFTKPVYVLTTDITRSAAESFVMQMKAFPSVKVVGTNTLGIISDMLGKTIGDYYLTVSNEKYVTPKGETYEVKGVDVDIKLTVFPKDNMFNGHRDAVRQVVKMIEEK